MGQSVAVLWGRHIMQTIYIAVLFSTVQGIHHEVPFTAFSKTPITLSHAPPVHHVAHTPVYNAAPAPVYHKPAPVHHKPVHHHTGHHPPKHNCSIVDVVEPAEVCTPTFETVCEKIEVPVKVIVDIEQCYPVTRTVCTESVDVIDNEICVYSYFQKTESTTAKTATVSYTRECDTQMVTVCQPTPGYGYHAYGHNYCKEVAQETCYNVPVVTVSEPTVEVAYPEPIKSCVQKPIDLIVISCEDITEEKCIIVPEVMDDIEVHDKCITQLGAPHCNTVELTLPKQVCKEINYGYAENVHEAEPVTYAPVPPNTYSS